MDFITTTMGLIGKRIANVHGAEFGVGVVVLVFDDGTAAMFSGCCDGDGVMLEDNPSTLREETTWLEREEGGR